MRNGLIKAWREYKGFALFIVLMIIFRSALADWNVVPTGSMKPTILEGDRLVADAGCFLDRKIGIVMPAGQSASPDESGPEDGDIVDVLAPDQAVVPVAVAEVLISIPLIGLG